MTGCAQRIAALLGSRAGADPEPPEPIHSSTKHVKFLEHMLLEEFVAPDRGNTVENA